MDAPPSRYARRASLTPQPSAKRDAALYCVQCGTSLPLNSRFCLACGTPVPAEAAAVRPAPAAVGADGAATLKQLLQQELGGELTVGEETARGPLTVTFSGVEPRGQRTVDVHAVPQAVAHIERGVVDRLLRAARAASRVRHPRINPVLRVAAGDRLAWYVTARPDGEPLQALLERDWQLPVDRVVSIIGQAATALGAAHELGVVHGDLTPASIMVDANDGVIVRDFGIARAARAASSGPGADAGYNYQAPELDGAASANPLAAAGVEGLLQPASVAADQYALGVIAYQMLTGSLPFIGSSPEAVRHEHQVAMVPPLAASRPDLPVALSTALERALSKNPGDRFPTVTRFAAAFRLAAQGRPSPTQPASKRTSDTLFFPEPARALRSTTTRNALAAVAVTGLLVLLAWQSRHAAWSSDTVNSRLVAPRPETVQTATSYGQTRMPAEFPEPNARPAAPESPPAEPEERPSESAKRPPTPAREQQRGGAAASRDAGGNVGFITLGTNPVSTIYINGVAAPSNPVRNWTVTPGRVYLRFEITDSGGVAVRDTSVVVPAGQSVNLGFVRIGGQ